MRSRGRYPRSLSLFLDSSARCQCSGRPQRGSDLGTGEAQALALALQKPNSLLILDDLLARSIAREHQLHLTGTAGVLLRAKQEGHIMAIEPLLDQLIQLDFRLSNMLREAILKLAQE